jgi:hypothetical protein
MRMELRLRSSSRFATIALAALTMFLLASSGQASAQGFGLGQLLGGGGGGNGGGSGGNSGGGLSQLFGVGSGGGGPRHQQYQQSDSASGISVERSAPPLTGKFTGKQDSSGMQTTITAQFACYPAHDADIPQSNAFVCYTGNPNAGGPPPGGRSDAGGNGPPAGGSGYGANGPPPGVE